MRVAETDAAMGELPERAGKRRSCERHVDEHPGSRPGSEEPAHRSCPHNMLSVAPPGGPRIPALTILLHGSWRAKFLAAADALSLLRPLAWRPCPPAVRVKSSASEAPD